MTKRDFFILIIKLFGLGVLISSLFTSLPSNALYDVLGSNTWKVIWVILIVLILVGLFILLVYKAHKVVDLLKLDKGFDEERIDLANLKKQDVIKIGTFIIGGYLFINNLSPFLTHTYFAFQKSAVGLKIDETDKYWWAVYGLNLFIGYLLIHHFDFVAKILGPSQAEEAEDEE